MNDRKQTPDMGDLLAGKSEEEGGSETARNTDSTEEDQHTSTPTYHNTSLDEWSGNATKATYYLDDSTIEALEVAWMNLRRAVDTGKRSGISKSAIVDVALRYAFRELDQGEGEVMEDILRSILERHEAVKES